MGKIKNPENRKVLAQNPNPQSISHTQTMIPKAQKHLPTLPYKLCKSFSSVLHSSSFKYTYSYNPTHTHLSSLPHYFSVLPLTVVTCTEKESLFSPEKFRMSVRKAIYQLIRGELEKKWESSISRVFHRL